MAAAVDAQHRRDVASSPPSTGPSRSTGGAAKASPSGVRRSVTSPAPHPCTIASAAGRAARGQPGVAGPERGVAGEGQFGHGREDPHPVIRAGSAGGSTNVVSDRFIQCANRCICWGARPSASRTTATGFPRYGVEVNTST